MTLNEIRKAYKSNQLSIEQAINETCNYLVTLDKSKMIDVIDWIVLENKMDVDGLSYDYFFKIMRNKLYIKIDTLEDIVTTLLKLDLEKAHKTIWKIIYSEKLNVSHGKVTFENCSKYGASYGVGEHPYCIYE